MLVSVNIFLYTLKPYHIQIPNYRSGNKLVKNVLDLQIVENGRQFKSGHLRGDQVHCLPMLCQVHINTNKITCGSLALTQTYFLSLTHIDGNSNRFDQV